MSHRQYSAQHSLRGISCGAPAKMWNNPMWPLAGLEPRSSQHSVTALCIASFTRNEVWRLIDWRTCKWHQDVSRAPTDRPSVQWWADANHALTNDGLDCKVMIVSFAGYTGSALMELLTRLVIYEEVVNVSFSSCSVCSNSRERDVAPV